MIFLSLKSRICGGLLALAIGFHPGASAADIEQQRQLFHDAAFALERNQIQRFNRILAELEDYPARPYLEYDMFRRQVSQAKPAQVEAFLRRYAAGDVCQHFFPRAVVRLAVVAR